MTLSDTKTINPNAIIIHSGILFDVFNPKIKDISITDGAHGLSNLCRFGGHSPKFYSVAQHSVLCSLEEGTPQEQLDCLCHDLTEYVLVDLPAPIKRQMPEYVRIEDNLQKIICERFNLTFPLSEHTHRIDKLIFKFEYESFFEKFDKKFDFWTPKKAKEKFLSRFYELTERVLIGK